MGTGTWAGPQEPVPKTIKLLPGFSYSKNLNVKSGKVGKWETLKSKMQNAKKKRLCICSFRKYYLFLQSIEASFV